MPSLCWVTVATKDSTMMAHADIVDESKISHTAATMDKIIQDGPQTERLQMDCNLYKPMFMFMGKNIINM